MWKKDDVTDPKTSALEDAPGPPGAEPVRPRQQPRPGGQATIGPSITIHGEVSGNEDLLIQGQVDGSVELRDQAVTIGEEGEVRAGIRARKVTVEGHVVGDLQAKEQVILKATARVEGDIKAPRLVLEDGASFRGMVDMGDNPSSGGKGSEKTASASATPKGSERATEAKPDSASTGGSSESQKTQGGPSTGSKAAP